MALPLSLKTPFLRTAITISSRRAARRVSLPIRMKVECRKKGLHPTFYEESKVYCDGELVMVTSGTQKEYNVDTWSGNHLYYLGQTTDYEDYFYGDEEDDDYSEYFDEEPEKK